MTRRLPALNPNDPNVVAKIIEQLEVMQGVRGNQGDRRPTVAEVEKMLGAGGGTSTLSGRASASSSTGSEVIPAKPTGLATTAQQHGIILSWERPSYSGHGKTEVWRSTTGLLQDATLIGVTGSIQFTDHDAGQGVSWAYFIRHVVDVSLGSRAGPFSDPVTETSAISFFDSNGKVIESALPGSLHISCGVITSEAPLVMSLDLTGYESPRVVVELNGVFYSHALLGGSPAALQPETGNAVSVQVSDGITSPATITPSKLQASHADPDGQVRHLHFMDGASMLQPGPVAISLSLAASRLFSGNADPFDVNYKVTVFDA